MCLHSGADSAKIFCRNDESESQFQFAMKQIIPLNAMRSGESGRVIDVCGTCPSVVRLQEIGVSVGAELRMVRQGMPCILALGTQRISLRAEDGLQVLVETA